MERAITNVKENGTLPQDVMVERQWTSSIPSYQVVGLEILEMRSALKDIVTWRIIKQSSCTKSQLLAWTTITSKRKNLRRSENCPKYAHKLCWNPFILATIGRLDILWSVNELARAVTKWTRACDRRLGGLISYIHHPSDHTQYCHVGNTHNICRLGLFQDSDFAGNLEDTESTSGGILCIF